MPLDRSGANNPASSARRWDDVPGAPDEASWGPTRTRAGAGLLLLFQVALSIWGGFAIDGPEVAVQWDRLGGAATLELPKLLALALMPTLTAVLLGARPLHDIPDRGLWLLRGLLVFLLFTVLHVVIVLTAYWSN